MNQNSLFNEGTKARISPYRTKEKGRSVSAEEILSKDGPPLLKEMRVPLEELSVEGLLSFGTETVFEFGRLNVLIGPNGTGKSNLLNCIRILRVAPLDIQAAFRPSGFEDWLYKGSRSKQGFLRAKLNVPQPLTHQLSFTSLSFRAALEEFIAPILSDGDRTEDPFFVGSYRSEAILTTAGTRGRRKRRLQGSEYNPYSSILSQVRDASQYPEIAHLESLYLSFRLYTEWTFGTNSTLRDAVPMIRSTTTVSELLDDLPVALNGLEKTSAHDEIRRLLGELKETYVDYVTRIVFNRVDLELLESPFESPLSAGRLSDGTLRFLALAAILLQPKPPTLICLEEPELGMHPDMIRMVAEMIIEASKNTQIIVTTHSEHLLTALQDKFDALFVFDAGLSGSIVRRYSQKEYEVWREDHNLGDLWSSGELGGNRW